MTSSCSIEEMRTSQRGSGVSRSSVRVIPHLWDEIGPHLLKLELCRGAESQQSSSVRVRVKHARYPGLKGRIKE